MGSWQEVEGQKAGWTKLLNCSEVQARRVVMGRQRRAVSWLDTVKCEFSLIISSSTSADRTDQASYLARPFGNISVSWGERQQLLSP